LCSSPRTSAPTRSLVAELLALGPTRARFPRKGGTPTRTAGCTPADESRTSSTAQAGCRSCSEPGDGERRRALLLRSGAVGHQCYCSSAAGVSERASPARSPIIAAGVGQLCLDGSLIGWASLGGGCVMRSAAIDGRRSGRSSAAGEGRARGAVGAGVGLRLGRPYKRGDVVGARAQAVAAVDELVAGGLFGE